MTTSRSALNQIVNRNSFIRSLVNDSDENYYLELMELFINATNRATALYSNKWNEHQKNAWHINLVFFRFNVRWSSKGRLIATDPKAIFGLGKTGFKEHFLSGMKKLNKEHFTYSEYIKSLRTDLKYIETNYSDRTFVGPTSASYFLKFLITPMLQIFRYSANFGDRGKIAADNFRFKTFHSQWIDFGRMSAGHRSENPFISKQGAWLKDQLENTSSDSSVWNAFERLIARWEHVLSENITQGFINGKEINMYDGTKKRLKPISPDITDKNVKATGDVNMNKILHIIMSLLQKSPLIKQTIDNDPAIYNLCTTLESLWNKENARSEFNPKITQDLKLNQSVDTDYHLKRYAELFLLIFKQTIDEYRHQTNNQKDCFDVKVGADMGLELPFSAALDPASIGGKAVLWGESTISNTLHYRQGFHGQVGKVREIYYALYTSQLEIIIKTTNILRDRLPVNLKREIYLGVIVQIITCLEKSMSTLCIKSGKYSFYTILKDKIIYFGDQICNSMKEDYIHSFDRNDLKYFRYIARKWNKHLSSFYKMIWYF